MTTRKIQKLLFLLIVFIVAFYFGLAFVMEAAKIKDVTNNDQNTIVMQSKLTNSVNLTQENQEICWDYRNYETSDGLTFKFITKNWTYKIRKFWSDYWIDRQYIMHVLYPTIGTTESRIKVLDIGFEYYNRYNKQLFQNDINIEYYGLDIKSKQHKDIKHIINDMEEYFKFDLSNDHMYAEIMNKYNEYFDVIIEFGVTCALSFNDDQIKNSLNNLHFMLKQNGYLLLKVDQKEREWNNFKKSKCNLNIIRQYFHLSTFKGNKHQIYEEYICDADNSTEFIIYSLQKHMIKHTLK
eukprot:307421_1